MKFERICVTGAGGFIGSHLVRYLRERGKWVRGVDIKLPEFSETRADVFLSLDLRNAENAHRALCDIDTCYCLAANMGGMGFISAHDAEIMHDNVLINANTLEAAKSEGVKRLFFASSACIYPKWLQLKPRVCSLCEKDAYPADPGTEYGWEKLYSERMYRSYSRDYGIETRIARFHNIFGPEGSWNDGREKAPAALCRKVATAKLTGDHKLEIWGDGEQTRSFCYIDDCIEMIYALMQSDYTEPLNVGTDRLVTINELADIIAATAGIEVEKCHDLSKPQGVRGRNADLSLMRKVLRLEPRVTLEGGIEETYQWIEEQVIKHTDAMSVASVKHSCCEQHSCCEHHPEKCR